jgi:coproporphyrinogen III oxidase-like Fe-S oxidoreductase
VRTPDRYIAAIQAGAAPEAGSETLGPTPRAEEACALALRTRGGATVEAAAATTVDELAAGGFVRRRDGRVVLTARGRLMASDVTARLLVAGAVGTR